MTLAVVFPGQGSQSSGMQAELAEVFPEVVDTYGEASHALGYDLWDLVQNGPAEQLDETVITQPAMLTAGIAAWRCWGKAGGASPTYLAGHSLGEYTALVVAESIPFADAVKLVQKRAELMQAAVPAGTGAMAAILGLDDDAVVDICRHSEQGEVVSAVNFNSPGQIVIAGNRTAVERAADAAKEAGARRALMLSISVPSHCALMQPAADALAETLENSHIDAPSVPVISNVDVQPYADAEQIRNGLARQLFSPVRWVETVQLLAGQGVDSMVECGPGKVLAGLTKRIDRSVAAICIDSPASLEKALS